MPDENLPPDGDESLPPPDADEFAAGEIHHLNDEGVHLPYDPPTPSEVLDTFSPAKTSPADEGDLPQGLDPIQPDPNIESVVHDLQPIVVDIGEGDEGDPPAPPPTETPPAEPVDDVIDQIRADERLAREHAAREQQAPPEHEWNDYGSPEEQAKMLGDILEPQESLEDAIERVQRAEQQADRGATQPGPAVESVVGDLQPIVELDTGGGGPLPETQPVPPARTPWYTVSRKPVYLWGVAVGVGVAGVAVAIALTSGGKSAPHAAAPPTTAPATTAAAAPATTSAPAVASPTTEATPPASKPPTVGSIGAVYTHRPPPKADNQNCDPNAKVCLGLPVKPVEVRYTTYTVHASDPGNRALTYTWSDSNSCGTFKTHGNTAVWDFSNYQGSTCPKGSQPQGTVSVVVSDGKHACTVRYPAGGAPGTGPKPQACTTR